MNQKVSKAPATRIRPPQIDPASIAAVGGGFLAESFGFSIELSDVLVLLVLSTLAEAFASRTEMLLRLHKFRGSDPVISALTNFLR